MSPVKLSSRHLVWPAVAMTGDVLSFVQKYASNHSMNWLTDYASRARWTFFSSASHGVQNVPHSPANNSWRVVRLLILSIALTAIEELMVHGSGYSAPGDKVDINALFVPTAAPVFQQHVKARRSLSSVPAQLSFIL